MLLIGKGKKKLKVTDKAYDNFYKNSGWEVLKQLGTKVKKPVKETVESEVDEWEGVEDDSEVKKPLSEMNRQELEEYAAELGVDLSGLTSNKQIREAIKAAM